MSLWIAQPGDSEEVLRNIASANAEHDEMIRRVRASWEECITGGRFSYQDVSPEEMTETELRRGLSLLCSHLGVSFVRETRRGESSIVLQVREND